MKYDLSKLQEIMKEQLNHKRYIHTLGVQYTAACMAMRYNVDMEQAQVAGLLHDCAKCLPDETLIEKCAEYKIPVTDTEMRNGYLLHGKVGAYLAQHSYDINEQEILHAIAYHTTGKPGMSTLEKIIFVADYIEPSRKEIPGLSEVRNYAFEDLDFVVYKVLKNTLSYLSEKKDGKVNEIDQMTVKAFEFYYDIIKGGRIDE